MPARLTVQPEHMQPTLVCEEHSYSISVVIEETVDAYLTMNSLGRVQVRQSLYSPISSDVNWIH